MSKASARDRLEQALARIADPAGEGKRACLTVYADAARAAADAADARAKAGKPLGPLDGAIVSIKDLYDVAGEVTRAGSRVLADEGLVAAADAPVVKRLREAGAVIVAKTNMSEFAFSGVGANPHFGTPGNPFDRARVPGGSTSGGAVAVADGMCEIAIGTDTGGSTRIPAALCGLVGWKPSKQRVPTDGAFPLSFTLDSIGPMAKSVADCALADAVMAGEAAPTLEPASLAGLRLGIWQGMPFDGVDATVSAAWSAAVARLGQAGVRFSDETISLVDDMMQVNAKGGFAPAEAYAIHRERLKRDGAGVDPIHPRAHRARRHRPGRRLHRHGADAATAGAGDGCAHGATRCAGAADDADRRADDRRGCGVRRVRPQERAAACATPTRSISSTFARSRCRCRGRMASPPG